ncbi:hypothetical protein OAE48_04180 [Flavobacteriales bacterium]|nr:hypothetical protein [Flavobacteriales bacterium]
MTEIQFHFDPVPPNPGGGGKFPWGSILFGVGLFAIIMFVVWQLTKDPDPETNVESLNEDSFEDEYQEA